MPRFARRRPRHRASLASLRQRKAVELDRRAIGRDDGQEVEWVAPRDYERSSANEILDRRNEHHGGVADRKLRPGRDSLSAWQHLKNCDGPRALHDEVARV